MDWGDGGQVGARLFQQSGVLLQAQARGLLLELEFGDALAQRVQRLLQLLAAFVAGAQLVGQVVIFAAARGRGLLALHLQIQRVLQAALGGGIGQAREFVLRALLLVGQRAGLLAGRLYGAAEFAPARLQAAPREGGLLGLALQRAQLLARFVQAPLGLQHLVAQLGMALLAVGQLHVQFLEAGFGRHAALLDVGQLGLDLGQVGADLGIARAGLLGQLRQAQGLDLQLMGAALRFAGLAPGADQALRGLGIGAFGTHQGRARFVGDQRLGAHFLSRCSISWARASRPDCSESCA